MLTDNDDQSLITVKTGKYREGDETKCASSEQPDGILTSFSEAVETILESLEE